MSDKTPRLASILRHLHQPRPSARIITLLLSFALLLSQSPLFAGDVKPSTYKGWNSLALTNNLIEVQIVPDIGGRVIQLKLGNFEYLWVNKQLAGKLPPPSGLGPKGEWLNYGGDKLWPAPQGWSGDDAWPGPPDAVLDGSPHAASVLTPVGSPVAIQLTSREDKRSGIQFSRVIRLYDNAARVSFDTTMKNIDSKPRSWGIWQVTQLNVESADGKGYNKNFRCFSPINPASIFPRGYTELFGLVNNPSFSADRLRGLAVAHYQRRVGKMGADNSAGWIATIDGANGYAFVERFTSYPARKYPDNASVTFWMSGPGQIVTSAVNDIPDDPIETPYLVESEIVGPLTTLKPGETTTFHLDWFVAKIGGNFPALACTDAGLTCQPLVVAPNGAKSRLTGRFGVFYPGRADLVLLDRNRVECGRVNLNLRASPSEPLVLAHDVALPPQAATVCLILSHPLTAQNLGELARTTIMK